MSQRNKTFKPTFSVSQELTIYSVSNDYKSIVSLMNEHPLVELNLADVTAIDGAGIQMLMLIKQMANRNQKEVTFVNHSQAVVDVMDLINVGAFFGDPVVLPANRSGGDL